MSTLDARKNFAIADLSTGYTDADVSISVETGKGALFPNPATEGAFNLVWWNYTDYKQPSDDPYVEIVRCTGRTGDTLTVIRAQEATGATIKNISGKVYKVMNAITKKMIDDIESNLTDPDNFLPANANINLGIYTLTARRKMRVYTTSYVATVTPDQANYDDYTIGYLSGGITFNAPVSPNDGDVMMIILRDNGSPKAITWNAIYNGTYAGIALPLATIAGKQMNMIFRYDANIVKHVLLWLGTQS